ncbi:MAG: phage major capsid protein [Dysgonamonadaceae bacterium]|jgi:hypothetical protein|nr:phage major capsid protein [Dysgonamonadaceae bacterium]
MDYLKNLIRNSKKSGLPGYQGRRNLRLSFMALGLIALVVVMFCLSGTLEGIAFGTMIAAAPVLGFSVPDGVNLSDEERKGLQLLADHFNATFKQFNEGAITEEKMMKSFNDRLKEYGEQNGISPEAIKKMQETLKTQGAEIASLKESPYARGGVIGGLKKAFFEQYDKFADAIKREVAGFVVKAPNEHVAANIQTTANAITTTTGANLLDNVTRDPELYRARSSRQYIHQIADISVVPQVPEAYVFDEEGSETGVIAVVAENGLKPHVKMSLIRNQANVQKAAGYIVVTEELMNNKPRVWTAIQRLFNDKVYRDYENQLTTLLLAKATQYISTSLDGSIANPTNFDAIAAAICQLETLNFAPDTLVINPSDKWAMALTTTSTGAYLFPIMTGTGQFQLLSLNVITTNKIAAGKFLLLESNIWKGEEESPSLRTGLVNDDLLHNRTTIVGEIRFLFYVPSNNIGGAIHGDFADIKEALTLTSES